jgi:DNA transposition AAA+ family ATPase
MYSPNGDLVKIERRPTEAVNIMDEQGNIRTFTSKGEAARELGVSPSMISKAIKNAKGGTPVINNTRTRQLKLMAADYTILSFDSMTEAAKEFNTNKMAISRVLKGKKTGDVVTINNTSYTLLE